MSTRIPDRSEASESASSARPDGKRASGARLPELDALRGFAVCAMVAWHACDGWLADVYRHGDLWDVARVFGGLAAPIFLLVTGAAVGLGAGRGRSFGRVLARSASLLVYGYLLRLVSWGIDRSALITPRWWPALALGLAFVILAHLALRGPRTRPALLAAGIASLAVHLVWLAAEDRDVLVRMLRFDVLHCIGVAGVVCALVVRSASWVRDVISARGTLARIAPWVPAALTFALALVLVSVAASVATLARDAGLERALAWLARADASTRSLAPFPVLPWCGYALAGCAFALAHGVRASSKRDLASRSSNGGARNAVVFALAIATAAIAYEGGPAWTEQALGMAPWLRPIGRLVFHASIAIAIAASLRALPSRVEAATRALGLSSLQIYLLHIELAYGRISRPISHALDPAACVFGIALLLTIAWLGAALRARGGGDRRVVNVPTPSSRTSFRRATSTHDSAFSSSVDPRASSRLQGDVIRGLMRPARGRASRDRSSHEDSPTRQPAVMTDPSCVPSVDEENVKEPRASSRRARSGADIRPRTPRTP